MKNSTILAYFIFSYVLFISLGGCQTDKPGEEKKVRTDHLSINVPDFNADSAYYFIEKQVSFGPRVPNTPAHLNCGDYLIARLKEYQSQVTIQEFQQKAYNGNVLNLRNIIGSFYPEKPKRILLAAHWDTRPFADKDSVRKDSPIDGANDGGSGVGVLLEVARIISSIPPANVGIDIILFDGEDYGEPDSYTLTTMNEPGKIWWCLGSQYWSENKHITNYMAYYGILLDMVGGRDARFYKEGGSMQFAKKIVDKVWKTASNIGYQEYFIRQNSPGITDDHVFINRDAKIPTINIVEYDPDSYDSYFGPYHHTHADNMNIIDKQTLKAVGQTLLHVLYNE